VELYLHSPIRLHGSVRGAQGQLYLTLTVNLLVICDKAVNNFVSIPYVTRPRDLKFGRNSQSKFHEVSRKSPMAQ
jgi:hypothetical protein